MLISALAVFVATTAATPPEHVGAEACGTCHEQAYAAWSAGPHARAMQSLSEDQAADPACRTCHTMVPDREDPELLGVQCESCHGAGRKYAPEHVMRDPVLARLLGLETIEAASCAGCHRPTAPAALPFSFAEAVQRVCVNRIAPSDRDPPPSTP